MARSTAGEERDAGLVGMCGRRCEGGMQEDVVVRELAQCVGVLQEEAGDVLGDGVGGMVDELFGFHSVGNGCRAFLGVDVLYLVAPFGCVCFPDEPPHAQE